MAHHVTQRGNARQCILNSDGERMVYLDLLRQSVQLHSLSVIGYCLMSNHVHLVVIPRKATAMAKDRNLKTVRTECNVDPPFAPSAKPNPALSAKDGAPSVW